MVGFAINGSVRGIVLQDVVTGEEGTLPILYLLSTLRARIVAGTLVLNCTTLHNHIRLRVCVSIYVRRAFDGIFVG